VRERLGEAGAVAPDLIPELPLTIRETRSGDERSHSRP
jgi:hypothetical protein